ncbi:MAG: ABC transporter permease, partial [Gammaproteobacteria bacterium]
LPPALLLMLSLSRYWTYPAIWPQRFQVSQWLSVFSGAQGIPGALFNSVAMASSVAVLATAAGFVTSWRVAAHPRRARLIALAHLPFALSPVVFGVSLLFVFIRLPLAGKPAGVVMAQWVFAYGYAVILLAGFWNQQVEALSGLACSLGATRYQLWSRVLLPHAAGILAVCFFQTFLISWFDYALVLLIGAGKVPTLTMRVFEYFGSGDVRLAATCALLLMSPPLLVLMINRRVLQMHLAARERWSDV